MSPHPSAVRIGGLLKGRGLFAVKAGETNQRTMQKAASAIHRIEPVSTERKKRAEYSRGMDTRGTA
jgi:hypothetical protein